MLFMFRFGLPVQPAAADEEAKKKSRLQRFASATKTDGQEEDKRKDAELSSLDVREEIQVVFFPYMFYASEKICLECPHNVPVSKPSKPHTVTSRH